MYFHHRFKADCDNVPLSNAPQTEGEDGLRTGGDEGSNSRAYWNNRWMDILVEVYFLSPSIPKRTTCISFFVHFCFSILCQLFFSVLSSIEYKYITTAVQWDTREHIGKLIVYLLDMIPSFIKIPCTVILHVWINISISQWYYHPIALI